MNTHIDEGAVKIIEIIGISSKSFDDAIAQALDKASKTVKGITGFEVVKQLASVEGGKIKHYKVNLKLAFPVV
ncbi:MAG: dodecin domain-containing protein [Ignavibacteriales bacterium]|nr:dodecin domain-containing protein [Ignavibacteriales bacterium]